MTMKINDVVEVSRDVPELGLVAGDRGVVVCVFSGGVYEVEFSDVSGVTVAEVVLDESQMALVS